MPEVWSPHYEVDICRIESIQPRFLRFTLRNLLWNDRLILPSYEHRLKLLNLPTLKKHRDYLTISFICKIINGEFDCPLILNRLNFKINTRNLCSIQFFSLANYTNYGRFNPLDSMLMLYNYYNKNLLDNNVKCLTFKLIFYNDN